MNYLIAAIITILISTNMVTAKAFLDEKAKTENHTICYCIYCVDAYWESMRIAHPEFHIPRMEDHIYHPNTLEGS